MSLENTLIELQNEIKELKAKITRLESQPIPYYYQSGNTGIGKINTSNLALMVSPPTGTTYTTPTLFPDRDIAAFVGMTGSAAVIHLAGSGDLAFAFSKTNFRSIGTLGYSNSAHRLTFTLSGTSIGYFDQTAFNIVQGLNVGSATGATNAGRIWAQSGVIGSAASYILNSTTNSTASAVFPTAVQVESDITNSAGATYGSEFLALQVTNRYRGSATINATNLRDVVGITASVYNYNSSTVPYTVGFSADMRLLTGAGTVANLVQFHARSVIVSAGSVTNKYSFKAEIDAGAASIYDGLNVGSATGATTGQIKTSADILPNAAGTQNLGNASLYWNDISYKTLTDRGCLFDTSAGIELLDGRIVTSLEALNTTVVKHASKKSIQGRDALDYALLPKDVYKPAPIAEKDILETDKDGNEIIKYRKGEKMGEDGAEMSALISILLGAVKEQQSQIEELKTEITVLKNAK